MRGVDAIHGGGSQGGSPVLCSGDALDYLELLADLKPQKLERAAVHWQRARLETEAMTLTLGESQTCTRDACESLCGREGRASGTVTENRDRPRVECCVLL
jgi:hypothetical protein